MSVDYNKFGEFLNRLRLEVGQMRATDTFHNAGWYNRAGDKIGWGDLDYREVAEIPSRLSSGELLYVLPEYKSFWDLKDAGLDESRPGLDWIWEHAEATVTKNGIIIIRDWGDAVVEADKGWIKDVRATFMPREHYKNLHWAFRPG